MNLQKYQGFHEPKKKNNGFHKPFSSQVPAFSLRGGATRCNQRTLEVKNQLQRDWAKNLHDFPRARDFTFLGNFIKNRRAKQEGIWTPGTQEGDFQFTDGSFSLKLDPTPDSLLRSFWPSSFSIKDTKKSKQPKKHIRWISTWNISSLEIEIEISKQYQVWFSTVSPGKNKKTKETSQNSSCHWGVSLITSSSYSKSLHNGPQHLPSLPKVIRPRP